MYHRGVSRQGSGARCGTRTEAGRQTAGRGARPAVRSRAQSPLEDGRGAHERRVGQGLCGPLGATRPRRTGPVEGALAEYRLARRDWAHHVATSAPAADIWARAARGPDDWKRAEREYEARYRLADADHFIVLLTVVLGRLPAADEWEEARRTATDVRDSREGTTYLQPAAYILVDLAEQKLVEQDALFKRTNGAQGVERRTNLPRVTDDTGKESYRREPVPSIVLAAIAARDDYLSRVPPDLDYGGDAQRYAFQSADDLFQYGQFEEARKRLSVLLRRLVRQERVGVSRVGAPDHHVLSRRRPDGGPQAGRVGPSNELRDHRG